MPLLDKVLQGDVLAAAKLIRGLEDDVPEAIAELKELYLHTGKAHIVGVSGPPGAGKSTLLGCLIGAFRKRGQKVGVVAIDPTSPLTGGAILGDRLRMQNHGTDQDVFIRSLASRGWKGGLSRAAMNTVHVMDAMGKDVIFVEAVGSGQGETDFARLTDTSVLVLVPGMGDEIQAIKAGIMEMADIFVINKADREGAESLKMSLEAMLDMAPVKQETRSTKYAPIRDAHTGCAMGKIRNADSLRHAASHMKSESWKPPVVLTEATNDKGTDRVVKEIIRHKAFLNESGLMEARRRRRAELELTIAVENALHQHMAKLDGCYLEKLVDELAARKTDPNTAAKKIIKLPRLNLP